jgi:hypothetical protein
LFQVSSTFGIAGALDLEGANRLLMSRDHLQFAPILPLAKLALEALAFGHLKRRDDTSLDWLAGLSRSFARSPIGVADLKERNKSVVLDGS